MLRFTAVSLEPLSSCKAMLSAGLVVVVGLVEVLVVLTKQNKRQFKIGLDYRVTVNSVAKKDNLVVLNWRILLSILMLNIEKD